MKKFKKMTALLSAMAITMSVTSTSFCAVAEESDTQKEVKVSFNITEDMTPSTKTDVSLFEDVSTTVGYYNIPIGSFEKEGYMFSGWTINGIDGYLSGDTYTFPKDVGGEIVFEPVWFDPKDTNTHNITYHLEYNGEIIEYPEWLKDSSAVAGQIVTPNYTGIEIDGAFTKGLILGKDHELEYNGRFVMPDEDVILTPIWFNRITFTYFAGDVDRLNGNDTYSFPKNEGSNTDLAKNDRFSRDGFNLVGWLSDYDGKIYKPLEIVTCPGVDVTFTAVWEPKTYNVVFRQGNGGTNLKVEGKTDTQIICPEPDVTVDGKTFGGWKDDKGNIYQAGSEYTILGAKPGAGIMLTAVWETGEPPVTTTTLPATTTQTTSTESATGGDIKVTLLGDANEDGNVNMADVTSIIQHIGNQDEYGLSPQGIANAELCDNTEGITGMDAMAIQLLMANQIDKLPYIE